MNDDAFRVMGLAMNGYQCSQILVAIALEAQGRENEELIRAMSGLTGGMGVGKTCGALTGGCCVLGMYAGHGKEGGAQDERLPAMLNDFVAWFEAEYRPRYGSIDCHDIVQDDMRNKLARCPAIVTESVAKLKEILADQNYEFDARNRE